MKGIVTRVAQKDVKSKFGPRKNIGFQLDEEDVWYNISFSKTDADGLGLRKGALVQFQYTENDYGNQVDIKSLSASESKAAPAKAGGTVAVSTDKGLVGIKVGHAINNAVALAAAEAGGKKVDIARVHELACHIIALSQKLEGQYSTIVQRALDAAKAKKAEAVEEEEEQEEEAEEEAPAPRRGRPPAKAAKPAPKGKGKPKVEEEEEQFDDDVPFN